MRPSANPPASIDASRQFVPSSGLVFFGADDGVHGAGWD